LEIGVIGGVTPAKLAMKVRKSGRSTGFTTGQITILDATVDVNYSERVARFDGQIVTTGMSAPGDSGSLLVAEDALLAVGLLFAGSEQVTIYNPIQAVLDSLQVLL
jgi:thymidine phosphorylase